jgi:hypothetical protein
VPAGDVLSGRQNKKDEAQEVDARDEIWHAPRGECRHGTKHQARPQSTRTLVDVKTDTP